MTQSEALAILKTGKNVFLTGEPGSGKTYTVNRYVAYLRSAGIEPAITASTGIAATHIDGMTIHSWSGIGIRKMLTKRDLQEMSTQDRLVDRILGASVLVIDEISMLDGRTLELIDAVCRAIRHSEGPFGDLQVVFVGDFFQLPPVSRYGEPAPQFAFASDAWKMADPTICYLSEHHRQDDEAFLGVLRAMRSGTMGRAEKDQLLARQVHTTGANIHADVPKLFPHNANVDELNTRELNKLSEEEQRFTMTAHGARALVEQLKRGCLSPEELLVKKGARVMFTKNSFNGAYVNGTTGVVVGFDAENGYPMVRTSKGTMIYVDPVQWSIKADGRPIASITQLPLRLAWAMTVHKSQGMSLDAAYVDLSQAFVAGQGYVALSRVRSLEGLHLGGLNDRALRVDGEVLEKDLAFREQSTQAVDHVTTLGEEKLSALQNDFLTASGGVIGAGPKTKSPKVAKPSKEQSALQTIALVRTGLSIQATADARGLTTATIVKHLDELRLQKVLVLSEIEHLREKTVDEILPAFALLGDSPLVPIYLHFKRRFNYDLIRLARVFIPPRDR